MDKRETRMEELKVDNMMHYLRTMFHQRDAIEATAMKIASDWVTTGPKTYLEVEDISLDDDPDYPSVVIIVNEKWQGNQETTTISMPLRDFALEYAEAGGWNV